MTDSRYSKIFEDLKRDLFTVAKRHGKRALREAVRDAAHGNLLQEDDQQNNDGEVPPEELNYPDEDVWTLPPAPDDEEESREDDTEEDADEDELSEAAERVLDRLMDRLKDEAKK